MDDPASLRPTRPVRLGRDDDRRPAAAGERRALRRDRGRRLDPRRRRAAGRSPATWSSRRCRSWTPPARKAGAARSTRSRRRRSTTLIPGHGAPMDRAAFLAWRAAFNNLLDCGASDRPKEDCVAGWRRDAARFIPAGREAMVSDRRRLLYRQPAALRAGGAAALLPRALADRPRRGAALGRYDIAHVPGRA